MADKSKEERARQDRQRRYIDSMALEGETLDAEAVATLERLEREDVPQEQRIAELVAKHRQD